MTIARSHQISLQERFWDTHLFDSRVRLCLA